MTAPARRIDDTIVEAVVVHGNLVDLTADERVAYYRKVCESVGLNPYTRPFEYITLSGKLTLYARKDCTDQLRDIHQVSVHIASRDLLEEAQLYTVTAHAARPDGRVDESTGVVSTKGLAGESLANALMRAETKAKRRVTLSICGLGWLDETEVDSIPGAARANVDPDTGEIRSTGRRQLARPGYVTAARAKIRLIEMFKGLGIGHEAAISAAMTLWGSRGSSDITTGDLDALVATVLPSASDPGKEADADGVPDDVIDSLPENTPADDDQVYRYSPEDGVPFQ